MWDDLRIVCQKKMENHVALVQARLDESARSFTCGVVRRVSDLTTLPALGDPIVVFVEPLFCSLRFDYVSLAP